MGINPSIEANVYITCCLPKFTFSHDMDCNLPLSFLHAEANPQLNSVSVSPNIINST
jgi:hypothetical protein